MKPLIGVTPLFDKDSHNYWINPKYMHGIETAGGLPVLLNLSADEEVWQAACDRMDGFLFTGGQDISPALYGEEQIPRFNYACPPRDTMETWMLRRLLEMDKPVLGICRGCQMINVVMGGTLYQDIPSQHPSELIHSQDGIIPRDESSHLVRLAPGSRVRQLMGGAEEVLVNSLHHEAVKDVAPGLVATAVATDGITEAVESPNHRFVLGVQWHPEFLWHKRQDMLAIFGGLIAAAGGN